MKELRLELELYVIAWNTALRDVVSSMDNVTLLKNAHPIYRSVFASQLLNEGMIDKENAKEFITIVGR